MSPGASAERYRRLELLGRGGMGEVYLADDLLLRRKVAIKVVQRSALGGPRADKLLRREAKAAAALDNPFICKVYEVGEEEGRVFIAMEYIQGETLRQRMQRGPIPIREAVSLAREIADGLEEAGRQRIVHRDLKPSNIIITAQGHVKIMDFGLAKRLHGEGTIDESSAATPDGMVVGTREYMSPEQLRGKPLEPSSDLFAFGIILFELIAGRHPFKKGSTLDTQFAILNEASPELDAEDREVPGELADLVERLLSKSAGDRPRIGEVRETLAALQDSARPEGNYKTLGTSASVEAFVARKPRVALAVSLVLLLLVVALSLWVGLRPEARMPQARMATLVTWPSNEEHAALSPDSKSVTFISNRDGVKDIWLLDLSGGEPRRITRGPGNLTAQTFSEDGKEVAYTLESETQNLFQTVRIDGGPPTRSIVLPADKRIRRLIRWVGDAVFMETQRLELVRLTLGAGIVTEVSTLPPPRRSAGFDVSRDGRTLAYSAMENDAAASIWLQPLGGEARPVTRGAFMDGSPFLSDAPGRGRLFFESNRSGQEDLWLMERPGREPRQITFGSNREFMESVSADGNTLVFSEVLESAALFSFDPKSGRRLQLTAENKRDITPTISADGHLAFARVSPASSYPWTLSSIFHGRLTVGQLAEPRVALREGWNPVLSPDGKWLAYLLLGGSGATPHLNLLNVESAHSRQIAEMPLTSRTFMAFPWYFSIRDVQWSTRNELWFAQGPREQGTRIVRLDPVSGAAPVEVLKLAPGEMVSTLVPNADGSGVFFVHSTRGRPGASVREIRGSTDAPRFAAPTGALALLGTLGRALIVTHQKAAQEDLVKVLTLEGGGVKTLFELAARPWSVRLVPGLRAVAYSRVDPRGVENIFLKDLDSGAETIATANGIQGIGFSPVSVLASSTLVYSQQLRNKDLGIIRLDRP